MMKISLPVMVIAAVSVSAVSCGGGSGVVSSDSSAVATETGFGGEELEMPVVPDSLRTPEDRAGYAAFRFWDSLDFRNDVRAADTAFIERNFANFGAILGIAHPEARDEAIAHLLGRVTEENGASLNLMARMADKYLGEGESPVFDEDVYLCFLRNLRQITGGGELIDEKIRLAELGAPGTLLSDFALETRDGKRSTFYAEVGTGDCVVMFYDSDCGHCRDAMTELVMSPLSDSMKVVAIDVMGERDKWESDCGTLPEAWTVGFSTEELEESDKYFFRKMPTIYVVSNGRVVERNPSLL